MESTIPAELLALVTCTAERNFGGGTADAKCLETVAAGNVTTLRHLRLGTKLPS